MSRPEPQAPPSAEGRQNGRHEGTDDVPMLPQHVALLAASGISREVIAARGYRSCTAEDGALLRELGFSAPQRRYPGLLIPIHTTAGTVALHQLRPDQPRLIRGKPRKYETPEGARLVLDVPPAVREQLADPSIALMVTEGARKADAAVSRGLCCISLLGVWGWRGTNDSGGKTSLPDWGDIALNDRTVYLAFDSDVVAKPSVATALAALKGWLETRGAAVKVIYLPAGPDGTKVGLDDFLAAGHSVQELLALAEDVVREPTAAAPEPRAVGGFHLTETGNAERLVAAYGDRLRFCHPWAAWLVWDGRRWKRDTAALVNSWSKDVVRAICAEANASNDSATRKALVEWAQASERAVARAAMVKLATSEPGIPIEPEQLDTAPFLLTTSNGTLDLRRGRLRPHDPHDNITKLAPVGFDPKATAPIFLAFLERVLPDPEVRAFLQRYLGYCLTGNVSEQCLLFLHGGGANGKSTLLTLMRTLLGDYARQAAPELLLNHRGERHPTELADLFGARLVTSVEVDEGRRFAETLVKQMTGGDPMKGRFMRADFFEWLPTHKLLLAANHRPDIRGTDFAIWRRIHLVPFEVTIPDGEKDGRLPEKLLGESSGILNWLVAGCLDWQRHGLGVPGSVREATAAYRAEQDVLGDFLAEHCVVDPQAWVVSAVLYRAYSEWVTGEKPLTSIAFGARLVERGFRGDRQYVAGKRTRIWCGLGLISPSAEPSPDPEPSAAPQRDTWDTSGHGNQFDALRARKPLNRNVCPDVSHVSRLPEAEGVTPPSTQAPTPDVVVPVAASTFTYITTREALQGALPGLLSARIVALDVETAIAEGTPFDPKRNRSALDPRRGRLRLMQLATAGRTFIIDVFAVGDISPLTQLFAGPAEFVSHNASFELGWLRAAGLPLPERMTDTMLLAKLVDAGRFANNHTPFSLAAVVGRFLGEQVDKTEQLSDWSVPELSEQQLGYAARDAQVLLLLRDSLQAAIVDAGLEAVAELEHSLLPFMAELEANGMPVDRDRWMALAQEAAAERDAIEPGLRELLGNPTNAKTGRPIPLSAGPQLGAAFEAVGVHLPKTEKGRPSTTEAVLKARKDQHPAIAKYLAWRHAATLATTFGAAWLGDAADGRVRAHFHQLGTVTGRTASSKPNLQQVPSDPRYRSCFTAPAGRVLVGADLGQVQVCCAAGLSGDQKLIDALNSGDRKLDVHRLTASALYRKPPLEVTAQERAFGKTIVFGTLFGQGVKGFLEQAAEHDLALTEREVRTFLDRFDAAWPQLARWRRAQMARTDTEIRSPLGRVRHVPADVRGTIRVNSPIQMLEADGVKHAMVLLWAQRATCPSAIPINFVHDELLYEVDAAEAPQLEVLIRRCLQEGMGRVLSEVTVRVDVKIGPTWAKENA